MSKWWDKVKCFFGYHNMQEMVDVPLPIQFAGFLAGLNPTNVTYSQCTRCGFTYNSRTVGIRGYFRPEGEEKK